MNALADGCTACFPGDAPAALPRNVRAETDGTLSADYRCTACGVTWRTAWKVSAAWPQKRDFRPASALLTELIGVLAELLSSEEAEAGTPE